MRWMVERATVGSDRFEDVGADFFTVDSGALVFRNTEGVIEYVIAPGQWVTVIPGED